MKKIFTLLTALMALGSLQLWGQSTMVVNKTDGTQIEIRVAEIENITFPSDDRTFVKLGYEGYWLHPEQWVQLEAVCTSMSGEEKYADITWKTTDATVATVDEDGVVTGVGDGTCKVLAVTDDATADITISVTSKTMIDIKVDEIGNQAISYTITPADASLRYWYDERVMHGDLSVDKMDQYGSMEQNIYHFARDWWDFCGSMYGMTWIDFMNQYGLYDDPVVHETATKLLPGSEYAIFAMALNEDGTLASPVEVKVVSTTAPERSDITFEVSIDEVTRTKGTFTITPSNDDPYFVAVQSGPKFVNYYIENQAIDVMIDKLTTSYTPDLYPESYCKGKVTRSSDDYLSALRTDEDYYIIIFGYNDGRTTDEVTLVKFHTLP